MQLFCKSFARNASRLRHSAAVALNRCSFEGRLARLVVFVVGSAVYRVQPGALLQVCEVSVRGPFRAGR